ncbi:PIN domain-containing protein [Candidatus Thiodiazotropha sp. LNASS1]|uniref:PIN domain-containing protein n=1 Tax=Candidatus Thiodiazotropha sp. LNASS1 TaxID=3096260 RepID=UPI000D333CFC|nr:PIN domain-containing protein [Candidatus Thiodiazotropha sp. (ex. Lucinisca nassula)]PUB87298.1 MAG: PIN domain nuclease [gamma proteobacterium symbiont of Ctena orbiculata]
MKILFDTNVILDVLLARKEFVQVSARLVGMVESKTIEGCLCATTITTLDYLISKALTKNQAKIEIKKILELFYIAEVNTKVLEFSVNSTFSDFEDAVQYYSGECCEVDGIVTRNTKDYKNTKLPVYTPDELLGIMASQLMN